MHSLSDCFERPASRARQIWTFVRSQDELIEKEFEMKNLKFVLLASIFGMNVFAFAAETAVNDPACTAIVAACEGAGYKPGEHKQNGKGLWVDCVGAIAKGKTVEGVNGTPKEARDCMKAKRQSRRRK
jgi:hypothetical protein